VAREDAVTIASYCKEETLEALKKEEIAKRVKYGFREGMEFDGERLSRRYPDGNYPIPFTRPSLFKLSSAVDAAIESLSVE